MKKIRFKCIFCGREFGSVEECNVCENSHQNSKYLRDYLRRIVLMSCPCCLALIASLLTRPMGLTEPHGQVPGLRPIYGDKKILSLADRWRVDRYYAKKSNVLAEGPLNQTTSNAAPRRPSLCAC